MFGLSFEHLIVLGIVLLIFGPRRLPELGHTMGKAIRNFKDALAGVEEANFRKLGDADSQKSGTRPKPTLADQKKADEAKSQPQDPSSGAPSA
jgi:sec-independent protein translocase protein TatA